MSVQITVTSDNIFSLGKELSALAKQFETTVATKNPQSELAMGVPAEQAPSIEVSADQKKSGKRTRAKSKSVADEIDSEDGVSGEDDTSTINVSELKTNPTVDVEEVRGALRTLISKGKEASKKAEEILTSFGVKKISELDPSKYGALLASVNAAL